METGLPSRSDPDASGPARADATPRVSDPTRADDPTRVSDPTRAADALEARLRTGEAQAMARSIADLVRHTPVLSSHSLSEQLGGRIVLKAESLQRTGSFKLRGALAKLSTVGDARGVVAGSAGNHGQALAYAARARGIACEIFMPRDAPIAKVSAVQDFGGTVNLDAEVVDDCIQLATERARQTGAVLVHPFDDPEVILGQATVALELLADVDELACVIVPIGGGGLIAGVAGAIKLARPEVHVVGVQAQANAPFPASLMAHRPVAVAGGPSIADGIAVKRPGQLTLALVERWVDEVVVVGEDDIAEAMVGLLERAKLVVEGAGAVGVAALQAGLVEPPAAGITAVVLSGGNVDAGMLATVARHHETAAGRRMLLFTRLPDQPGALAGLLDSVAQAGGNLLSVEHVRDAVPLHVRQSGVELVIATRGADHARRLLAALADAGYEVERIGTAGEGRA